MHNQQESRAGTPRRGHTIIEVLVALVVVSVGLLAVAGASALSRRTTTSAVDARRALRRLDHRFAVLAATGCAGAASGSLETPGARLRERWMVSTATRGAAPVEAVVEWREGARVRSMALRSAILC